MTFNAELEFGAWRRSSYSSGGDNCVDIALSTDASHVRIRDSKAPADPPCVVTAAMWEPLLAAVAGSRPADLPTAASPGDKASLRTSGELAEAPWQQAGPEAEYAFVDQVDGATYVVFRQAAAMLVFTMAEWDAFVAGVRDGEFTLVQLTRRHEDTPLLAQVRAEAAAARGEAEAAGPVTGDPVGERPEETGRELADRH